MQMLPFPNAGKLEAKISFRMPDKHLYKRAEVYEDQGVLTLHGHCHWPSVCPHQGF